MYQKRLYPLWLLGVLLLWCQSSMSATYYVSSETGNDNNDGLSEATPWQSLNPINEIIFEDNSSILFKRGEVFRGAISLKRSPQGITFSTYGSGEKPTLAGSVAITGWQPTTHRQLSPQVYEADVSTLPLTEKGIEHLFANGELMTIARYPNVNSPLEKNWLQVDATAGKNGFTDQALVDYRKPDDYWKGATLRIRNYSWTFMVTEITGFKSSSGKITAERLSTQLPEWGYFIDGKLTELDHPGEWYYDAPAQKVYFHPPNGQNPNQMLIEGATFDIGIGFGTKQHRPKIEQLNFRHYTEQAVRMAGVEDALLQDCHFENNRKGIYVWNSPNVVVKNNTLTYQFVTGISLAGANDFDVKASIAENNHITYTGMYRSYTDRYDGISQGIGIGVSGKAYTVRQNVIEYTSHGGIALRGGGNHIIENNVIRDPMLLLNDGGAIVIGSDANVIRGNILLGSVGNIDESNGCGFYTGDSPCPHHHSYGMGVGANPDAKDMVIENNTVANNAHQGIRLNSFTNAEVRNNVLYNNNSDQVVIEDIYGGKISRNNLVEKNIFYMLATKKQIGIKLTGGDSRHGTLENNYYCNPYNEIILERDKKVYSLAHWQARFSYYDQKSKQCDFKFDKYQVTESGTSLIANGSFDTTIADWKGIGEHDVTQSLLDGGSLKATFPSGKNEANVFSPDLSMVEGQLYRLKFSIVGSGFGTIRLRINNVAPDAPERLLWERHVAYDQTRKEYEWFFTSPVATPKGKVLWATTKEDARIYWLDNVTFEPVTATKNDPTQKSVLFVNPEDTPQTIDLKGVTYADLDGKTVTGSITLQPFTSQILIYISGDLPPSTTQPVLTINKSGTGSGTVTANAGLGSGINCGTSCSENYEMNSQITLTATPDANSLFAGWEGTGCGDAVTITNDMTCTAIFNSTTTPPPPPPQEDYTISITKQGDGTISSLPRGISCGNKCSATFSAGTEITLIPSTNLDSQFAGFTGDPVCNNEQIVLDQDVNCIANFEPSFAKPFTPPVCTPNNQGDIAGTCNAQGGQLNDAKIEKDARVSRVDLTGDINNEGWLSNATVKPEATVSGGKMTGYVTNEGTIKDVDFRGAKLEGGTLAGQITSRGTIQDVQLAAETEIEGGKLAKTVKGDTQSPATLKNLRIESGSQLSDVVLGEGVKVAKGTRLGGRIQNTGENILTNVQFDADAQLTGGQLSGKIEGNPEGMPLLEALTIEAKTQLSQVIIGNDVQLGDEIVLIDSEFRGQTLTGVTLGGTLQNTGEGTVQDVDFQGDTLIIGGKVAGPIKGNSRAKVELQNVEVQAGSELSDVIIGENVQLPPDVILEPGKIHFTNASAIPPDFDLTSILPPISQTLPCGEQVTLPERFALDNHVLLSSANESIINDINNMLDVQARGWQMTQDPVYGYLQTNQDDIQRIILQPISLKPAPEEGEQLQMTDQQQITFTTATGMMLVAEPAMQALCDLQFILANLGLPEFSVANNGHLKIPAAEGDDWFSARPDWASTPTERFPGMYFLPPTEDSTLSVATLVFEQNGEFREQKLYPAVALPDALNAVAEEVTAEADNGLISFNFNGQNYRGMMDYLVTIGPVQSEDLQVETQTDLNGDGVTDATLIYPTGEQQNMFLIEE